MPGGGGLGRAAHTDETALRYNIITNIAMFGWIPLVLVLFVLMRPRRAVIAAYLIAWLFLPMAIFRLPGLPDYSKVSATTVGVLLGVMLFDMGRLLSFRPRWFDLPMLVWCLCPFMSSLLNGQGAYDGVSAVATHVVVWGLPYLTGRVYFSDQEGLKDLAVGIFLGGLIYIPFCAYEMRFSPQLHNLFYGYHQHAFNQTWRFGGYRPMVFMQHGLMVAMWMTSASLVGWWLWRTRVLRHLWGVPMGVLVAALLITTVFCRSLGALALLMFGVGTLLTVRWLRSKALVACLMLVIPLYIGLRCTGLWSGEGLVAVAAMIDEDRAASLAGRLDSETALIDRTLQRPMFGWGSGDEFRISDERGEDVVTIDGMWIITLGHQGLVGLIALTLVILLPTMLLMSRFRGSTWTMPPVAPAAAMGVLLVLYMLDNLLNAMVNPIYTLIAGGLVAFGAGRAGVRPAIPAHRPR